MNPQDTNSASEKKEEPRVVRKYSNRRLYDSRQSKYINLDELKDLILAGEPLQVVNASDGADITRQTLVQVLLSEEVFGEPVFSEQSLRNLILFFPRSHARADVRLFRPVRPNVHRRPKAPDGPTRRPRQSRRTQLFRRHAGADGARTPGKLRLSRPGKLYHRPAARRAKYGAHAQYAHVWSGAIFHPTHPPHPVRLTHLTHRSRLFLPTHPSPRCCRSPRAAPQIRPHPKIPRQTSQNRRRSP